MDQQDVLIGCWLGRKKVTRLGHSGPDQPVMYALIFLGGEDVGSDGQVVVVTVDELEGEHSALSSRTPH
jgi:hypothetical protein